MRQKINFYLNSVDRRESQATPGPWKRKQSEVDGWKAYSMITGYQRSVKFRDLIRNEDADFMAHARTDVRVLKNMLLDSLEFITKLDVNERALEEFFSRLDNRIEE